jgi:shikimate dehydrogenase
MVLLSGTVRNSESTMSGAATRIAEITGRTRVLVLVGDPIHAAKSPQLFNPLFVAQGRDAICIPMQVPSDGFDAFVAGMRRVANLDGLLVTMPHKTRMAELVDELHPSAGAVGAVNVVRNAHGRWTGAMFDGWGCVLGMRWEGHDPRGQRVFLIGAGGAGSAIAFAVAEAGARALTIRDVNEERGQALANAVGALVPSCETRFGNEDDPTAHDIIINATPLGMRVGDALPVDPMLLPVGSTVVDVITQPDPTPLCQAALSRGCRVQSGRAMHEGQAVYAAKFLDLEYWPAGRPRIALPGPQGRGHGQN